MTKSLLGTTVVAVGLFFGFVATPVFAEEGAYRFVCEDDGAGLSVVDVLQATGDHETFLELFGRVDPEGFAILADPELADKTVWAPTDAAFAAILDEVPSRSDEEIAAILGYHVSPPRRSPGGAYPIVTPQFLADAQRMTHRTRTGVLRASEQRTRTSFADGVLRIEDARILDTAWCTEAGSVFSIDAVITDVAPPSALARTGYRLVRILFYDDVRFVIYSTVGAVLIGTIVARVVAGRSRRTEDTATSDASERRRP
jgi:uncharacterized surface protein with fasciclin (FAS1) repeats